MCIATIARPTDRTKTARTRTRPARLLLVIAARTYRLWPHSFDLSPENAWEWKHVLQGPDGRRFEVYERALDLAEARALDLAEARALLVEDAPYPRKYTCGACGDGDCDHVAALVELGLL